MELLILKASPEGLYYCTPSETLKRKAKMNEGFNHNIITVKDNMQGYTTRQIKKTDEARKLYHIIGTPTVENFKGLIKMNMIANNPITVEDVDRAEKIYGPSIYSMKEKTTREKPKVVVNDTIEIPKELITKNLILIYVLILFM